jgi:hypothetical protein
MVNVSCLYYAVHRAAFFDYSKLFRLMLLFFWALDEGNGRGWKGKMLGRWGRWDVGTGGVVWCGGW